VPLVLFVFTLKDRIIMALKAYRFVGLNKDIWLPDDIKVQIRIIDHPRFRSYTYDIDQIYTVFHSTGNSKTNAEGEYEWAAGGRQGGSVGGYTAIVDDKTIIQAAPLNEVTWAQGVNWGNVQGWATEFAYGGNVNYEKALRNVTCLHAALIFAKGWDVDKALKPHQFFTGKYCPSIIFDKGDWNRVVRMVKDQVAVIAAHVAGSGVKNEATKTYPKPVEIPELAVYKNADRDSVPSVVTLSDGTQAYFVSDIVEATKETPRLRYANKSAEHVGELIRKGEQFSVDWLFTADDGQLYFYTRWGTRIIVADTKRVGDLVDA
jgi:N-acetylmuramoyl-L-alanine amidase CwlA